MGDGSQKLVAEIIKGDIVQTPNGTAQVKCVVKTLTKNGASKICHFPNGLMITPGHPMMYNGVWTYPRDLVAPTIKRCSVIYNMVLEKDHIIIINGVPLILLGHSYTQDSILKHEYLGS